MRSKIFKVIMAIISIVAIIINMNPDVAILQSVSGNSVICFFLFVFIYSFSNIVKAEKKNKKISFVISVLLMIMMVLGKFINEFGTIFIIDSSRQVAKLIILVIGYQWLIYNIVKYVYCLDIQKINNNGVVTKFEKLNQKITNPVILFFLCMILILIAWSFFTLLSRSSYQ